MSAAGSTIILMERLETLAPDIRRKLDYRFVRIWRCGFGFRVRNRSTLIENYFYGAVAAARYIRKIVLGRKS